MDQGTSVILAAIITAASTLTALAIGNRRRLTSIEVKVDGHLTALISELEDLRVQVTGLGGDPTDSAAPPKQENP